MPTTSVRALALFLAIAGVAFAQAVTGGMFGSITDSSGAVIPQVEVTLVSSTTGAQRVVQTGRSGEFVLDGLEPGEYSITVKAPGFKTLERTGIRLSPSERLGVGTLSLDVGASDQHVTITAEGATVQTASAERSSAITAAQTEELPVYGRSVTSLVAIAPGVVDPVGASTRTLAGTNATNFNVAGNRSTDNNFSVDGVVMSAVGGAANGTFMPSMEAISEVKVLTSNYQAEYGRLSGSDVQMVTKSGTREFHGMAMYYGRNEDLNANNFFNNSQGLARPVNRFNAITYNVGGPVWLPGKLSPLRNKIFFFWNQEFLPQHTTGGLQYTTMPTALERAGNFSQTTSGGKLVPIIDPNTGSPFPGNIIPPSRIDSNGLGLLDVLPMPNASGSTVYNYVTQASTKQPIQLATLKLDYNARTNDVFSVTLLGDWETDTGPANGAGVTGITAQFPLVKSIVDKTDGEMVAAHYTHIFNATNINELTFGYALDYGPSDVLDQQSLAAVQRSTYNFKAGQLNLANNPLNLLPGMSFSGVSDPPNVTFDGRFPYDLTRYLTDVADKFTHIAGSHTLKAGFSFEHMRQFNGLYATNFNGLFNFGTNANNPLNTGNPYSNAILGVFNNYTEATANPVNLFWSNGVDTFVSDTWRVTRKLTLDYGVRVSWYTPFYSPTNQVAGFVPSLYNPTQAVQLIRPALIGGKSVGVNPITGQTYPSALIGFIAPGSGNLTNGMVIVANTSGYPRGLINNFGPLVAPRLGFAYDPFGDGKTAIRGGFGIFYNRPLGYNTGIEYSYPIVQTPVVEYGSLSTFTSAQGFVSPPSVVAWQKNAKSPTVMNMSLTIQRNIGFGTVLDVGYVGSFGRHLGWAEDLEPIPLGAQFNPANANPASPGTPLPNAFLVPLQGYSAISYYSNDATSNYHSLQVTANRRFARGVQFGFAYTWSKALDWTDTVTGAVNNDVPASLFRAWNYGLAGFDRKHLVKINWIWDVPKWKSAIAPVRAVVNDWQVFGIATFSSGAPLQVGFTQVTATNITGSPSVPARINVNGDPYQLGSGYGPLQAFNPTVFSLPAVGTLGDPSKTLIRGPGLNDFDISLVKNMPIKDRLRLQLRVEMYNAFNHTQFSAINTTALFNAAGAQTNSQFGQYTAAQNPRIMQWAVRLQF
jgi:outer membrane receptor protein involved in Fe transport